MSDFAPEVWKKFMKESNKIEGENRLNPGDIKAIKYVITHGINNVNDILVIHALLGAYLKKDWVGKFRTCQVYVGNYIPPLPAEVPYLMEVYVNLLPNMNAWEAHNRFETIHPFRDLNGRVGRLIWLSRAIQEGYNFRLSFLHAYYYQTLDNQQYRRK